MNVLDVQNLTLSFGENTLFSDLSFDIQDKEKVGFVGVNGAGKTSLFKIITGEYKADSGNCFISKNARLGYMEQHTCSNDKTIWAELVNVYDDLIQMEIELDSINEKLKTNHSKELIDRQEYLNDEFTRNGGLTYKSMTRSALLGLGFSEDDFDKPTSKLSGGQKSKLILAKLLLSKADFLLLDEPTNHLDIDAISWLEDFLADYFGTVLVVSHDRHFLNNVCTHIVDIDYTKIKMYVGNYEFWYESSQLMQRMIKNQNKKAEEKIKELQEFINRFSANKSKSKQATARRKLLDKLTVEEMPASSRKYPFIGFNMDRELGKDVLKVNGISKTVDGVKLLNNVSFTLSRTDKVAFIGESEQAITMLFKILAEEEEPDEGSIKWGVSTSRSYFPIDNSAYFNDNDESIVDWIRKYSTSEVTDTYLRGFLGKMLFSGDEIYKPVKVLSGGEKVRCMFSRMMLFGSNVIMLDRPTNHLDLESITAVNNGLRDFKGVVIFASHDHEIVQTVANRIIEITPDGCIDRQGTYEEFLDWRRERGMKSFIE